MFVFLAVRIKRVLSKDLNTGERGRTIGERVVEAVAVADHELTLVAGVVAPTRTVRQVTVNEVVGTNTGREGAFTAHGDVTEVTFQVNDGFTAEEAALAPRTVVTIETVFEDETGLHTVAEFFRTLDRDTGTGVLTGLHAEGVFLNGIKSRIRIRDLVPVIVETRVDTTGDRDVRSHGRASKGAESSDSNERLLEHFHSLMSRR